MLHRYPRPFLKIAGLALVSVVLTGCGGESEPEARAEAPRQIEARLEVAELENLPRLLVATGTVEPSRRAAPGTKILGRVAAVEVREGERVAAGQPLARFEDRDLRAAADQARAAVAMAEAQLENAEAQLVRIRELHGRGSVTEKNLEDAVAGERVARAGLEQSRAALASAEVMLSYARVASPFDGWLTAKHAEVGDLVAPGQPIFEVEDLDPVKIVVDVPEGEVRHLAPRERVKVAVEAVGAELEGEIDRIVPSGDRRARTFQVQIVLANGEGELKSGMFARASFELGETEALFIPRRALVERGQLEGVFVVDAEGRSRLRWVRTGESRGERVAILSGLAAGERYVAEPPAGLVEGTIVDNSAPAEGGGS